MAIYYYYYYYFLLCPTHCSYAHNVLPEYLSYTLQGCTNFYIIRIRITQAAATCPCPAPARTLGVVGGVGDYIQAVSSLGLLHGAPARQ